MSTWFNQIHEFGHGVMFWHGTKFYYLLFFLHGMWAIALWMELHLKNKSLFFIITFTALYSLFIVFI
ncbi:hypothetical protein ACJX0J_037015, partial [Zea mays]